MAETYAVYKPTVEIPELAIMPTDTIVVGPDDEPGRRISVVRSFKEGSEAEAARVLRAHLPWLALLDTSPDLPWQKAHELLHRMAEASEGGRRRVAPGRIPSRAGPSGMVIEIGPWLERGRSPAGR